MFLNQTPIILLQTRSIHRLPSLSQRHINPSVAQAETPGVILDSLFPLTGLIQSMSTSCWLYLQTDPSPTTSHHSLLPPEPSLWHCSLNYCNNPYLTLLFVPRGNWKLI